MAQPYLSLQRAKELVVEVVEASPRGWTNPREDDNPFGSCVYVNDRGEHCIVGEILYRMGMPLPAENGGFCYYFPLLDDKKSVFDGQHLYYVEKGYMGKETAAFLGELQAEFDKLDACRPRTWRKALKECRKQGLI